MPGKTKLFISIIVICICTSFATAGVMIKNKTHTDPVSFMGHTKPATDSVQIMWLEKDKMLSEQPDENTSIIVRLDQNKIYFIDNKNRSFSETTIPIKLPPQMAQMMQAMTFKTTIKKTGATKTINGYKCEEVVMNLQGMMNLKIDMWCTKEISIPTAAYYKMSETMVAFNPAMKEMMEKMRALGSLFPVMQEVTGGAMGVNTHTITKLVEFKKDISIPSSKFEPPKGYTRQTFDLQKLMQKK